MAFLLPEGGASILLLNRGKEEMKIKPVWLGQVAECVLPPESLTAIRFEA